MGLFHRDELDQFDVRVFGQQLGPVFAKGRGDGSVEVGLPVLLGVERVENSEGVLVDPEGVPGPGAGLRQNDLAAAVEEVPDVLFLPRLGFDQCKHSEFWRHGCLLTIGLDRPNTGL